MRTLNVNCPQFFFDDHWLSSHRQITRHWHAAELSARPALEPEMPWEGTMNTLYGSVMPAADGGWRMYYTGWNASLRRHPHLLMAQSEDGIRWRRDKQGHIDINGTRDNNALMSFTGPADSPSVVYEPSADDAPYKAVIFESNGAPAWNPTWGLYLYKSDDGIHWHERQGPFIQAGDVSKVMSSRVDGQIVIYTRHPKMFDHVGARAIYRTTSEDWQHWSDLELVLAPDVDDAADVQFYGMAVFKQHDWWLGLLEYWRSDIDVIEIQLAVSRDGKSWRRPHRQPFIGADTDWNRKWTTCASNGPIVVGDQMIFMVGGRNVSHGFNSAQQYGAIGVASLAIDRFCAIEGRNGQFTTPPFVWPGGELTVNADTRQSFASHPYHCDGKLEVEILSADGEPKAEWSGENTGTFVGNTHCRCTAAPGIVKWPNGPLHKLKGEALRLRFHLKHARLYTFAAVDA